MQGDAAESSTEEVVQVESQIQTAVTEQQIDQDEDPELIAQVRKEWEGIENLLQDDDHTKRSGDKDLTNNLSEDEYQVAKEAIVDDACQNNRNQSTNIVEETKQPL